VRAQRRQEQRGTDTLGCSSMANAGADQIRNLMGKLDTRTIAFKSTIRHVM
jgi:hypothetical protein